MLSAPLAEYSSFYINNQKTTTPNSLFPISSNLLLSFPSLSTHILCSLQSNPKPTNQPTKMYASVLVAGLAASAAYASPLNARRSLSASSYSGAPTGVHTATSAVGPNTSVTATATTPLLGVPTGITNPPPSTSLIGSIILAGSEDARLKVINATADATFNPFVFDFNPIANPPAPKNAMGGQVDLATSTNFPVLTGLGLSAGGLFFQPCGLNTPHIHPRATEFFTVVTDSKFETGFVMDNGFNSEIRTNLTQFQGTVFPQGSIHWQQNMECTPATAIAGLSSEDPGASSIAQNFLSNTSADIIDAALGFPSQINADNFAQFKANIPVPFALGIESCLKRCNIPY